MAHTVISVKLPPNIDPTKSRIAYGDRALPKLVSIDYFGIFKLDCTVDFVLSDTGSDVLERMFTSVELSLMWLFILAELFYSWKLKWNQFSFTKLKYLFKLSAAFVFNCRGPKDVQALQLLASSVKTFHYDIV